MEGEEEIGKIITDHYKSLFMSSAGIANDEVLSHMHTSVTHDMNSRLTREFTE